MATYDLKPIFDAFCAFGGGTLPAMDNAKFAKFARDTKILDKKLTSTDIDLIFSKIEIKGERKISYEIFRGRGIPEMAGKKGMTEDQLVATILHTGGPQSSGTHADAVRFHDDKSQYTGVYAQGGPTNVDLGTSDLRFITNREGYDIRGVNYSAKRS
eukprot:519890_1